MAEGIEFGVKEAQIIAAREIGKLNSKQKQKLVENGVICPLVLMLHSHDYDSIEAALLALLHLAFGSERNKLRIAKGGSIAAIINVIQCQNSTNLTELSLAALLILSSCSANKLEIASSGTIQLLLQLLNGVQFSVSNQAKYDIMSTLHNLSTCHQIIPTILASGGLTALIQLIYESDKSSELAERAVAVLESIVSSSEVALNQAREAAMVIPMLVEAVEEGSPACQEHAAAVLLLICKSCRERFRGMILNEGAMAGLLQLSVYGTWIAQEKAKALILLLRDRDDEGGPSRGKCSKNKAFEEVMRRIDREERDGNCMMMVEEMIAKLRT